MFRVAALLAFAMGLVACDAISTLTEEMKFARAVEGELEQSIGLKPQVGFNWNNGRLLLVTVTFPRLYEVKPLHELAATVRNSVNNQFKQTPENTVLAFSLGK